MFSHLICANDFGKSRPAQCMGGSGDYIFGANQAGKHACSLLNCISVMDDTRINEQNKSIATGILYIYAHSEFDAFSTFIHGEM